MLWCVTKHQPEDIVKDDIRIIYVHVKKENLKQGVKVVVNIRLKK